MDSGSSNRNPSPRRSHSRRQRKRSPVPIAQDSFPDDSHSNWGAATAGSSNAAFPAGTWPASENVEGEVTTRWGEPEHWLGAFERGDDFIALGSSSDDDGASRPIKATLDREWDKGKQPIRDPPGRYGGQKRRREADILDQNDGYAQKKIMVDSTLRKAPWVADVQWEKSKNVAEMLHQEVEAFVHYISPTSVEHDVRSYVIRLISNAIRKAFRDAVVLPFGSFETKLYLPLGDIDLVVQSKLMAEYGKDQVLKHLANILRRAGITDRVTIIAKAKVPIVKFVTTHGRFSVDISLNQTNGVAAGKMVNQFLNELPALRSLVLVVKSFLNQRSMNEVFSGGLGSYSIVCLIISFLQLHPKIRRGEINPSRNLGVLAMEFFELYGRYFNYEKTGISIRHGGSYFSKLRKGWFDPRKPSLLSIEDPGDMTNDISRGSFNINHVRQTFAGAYEIMSTAAYLRAGVISARQEGQFVDLREHGRGRGLYPEGLSILASIMGVTQETINHRRCVQELFDSGALHSLLGIGPPRIIPETDDTIDGPACSQRSVDEQRQTLKLAWEEADVTLSPRDTPKIGYDTHDESESRYAIDLAEPARKRRKMGGLQDAHTVFLTDDDDDDHWDTGTANDSLDGEEAEYDLNSNDEPDEDQGRLSLKQSNSGRSRNTLHVDRKRAYWASKGLRDVSS